MYNCIHLNRNFMKMKALFSLILVLLCSVSGFAQIAEHDSIDQDSILINTQLQELVITNVHDTLSADEKKQLAILRRRVLKVYPYAKIAADRLTMMNNNMAKLKSEKDKKKYAKIIQNYLEDEFEGQLKKLTRKEGQILVKLIYRQTGKSTFDLIKEQKSSFKAFWSNRMAHLFDIDLKKTYSPGIVAEDFLIEGFLLKAFEEHRLQQQDPAFTIDYAALKKAWKQKNKKAEG